MKNLSILSSVGHSFIEIIDTLIPPSAFTSIVEQSGPKRRRPPRIEATQWIKALVYHLFEQQGTLSEHFQRLYGQRMSDSALSQRRMRMPWEVFEQLMQLSLKPLALVNRDPGCFYQGLRLVALDGTQFSVSNTPQVLGQLSKAVARRFQAAFAKVGVCVMVELGNHNPIAAAVGKKQQEELSLADQVMEKMPEASLLLADRLYGTAWTLWQWQEKIKGRSSEFLFRVRRQLQSKVVEVYKDGSALVEVKVRDRKKPRKTAGAMLVREVQARIKAPGTGVSTIRIWSSLLDWRRYPGKELVELYAKRWEQELYYKQLKIDLRSTELLHSHTVETAAQEIAAMIVASGVLARQRERVGQVIEKDVLRISFAKVLTHVRSLWFVLAASAKILSKQQQQEITECCLQQIAQEALLAPRRKRNCPRAVRQPIRGWPRLTENQSYRGPNEIEILRQATPIS